MNSFNGIGRLTRDPETRYAQNSQGTSVTRFTIAIDRQRKRDGEQSADFLNCVAFGNVGEVICKYFTKGRRIGVTGRVQTGSYKKQDGTTAYTTDIVVESVTFCDSQQEPAKTKQHAQEPAPAPQPDPEPVFEQDTSVDPDLPF